MTREEQVRAFEDTIASIVIRFGDEFPLVTLGDIIMVLEKEKFVQLCRLHQLVQRKDN
jgi:hypothetical protein